MPKLGEPAENSTGTLLGPEHQFGRSLTRPLSRPHPDAFGRSERVVKHQKLPTSRSLLARGVACGAGDANEAGCGRCSAAVAGARCFARLAEIGQESCVCSRDAAARPPGPRRAPRGLPMFADGSACGAAGRRIPVCGTACSPGPGGRAVPRAAVTMRNELLHGNVFLQFEN